MFRLAKDVWNEEAAAADAKGKYQSSIFFPIGAPNDAFRNYFIGQSYIAPVSTAQIPVYNVTFEPGCRNNWHIHRAKNGGGQMLICVAAEAFISNGAKSPLKCFPER